MSLPLGVVSMEVLCIHNGILIRYHNKRHNDSIWSSYLTIDVCCSLAYYPATLSFSRFIIRIRTARASHIHTHTGLYVRVHDCIRPDCVFSAVCIVILSRTHNTQLILQMFSFLFFWIHLQNYIKLRKHVSARSCVRKAGLQSTLHLKLVCLVLLLILPTGMYTLSRNTAWLCVCVFVCNMESGKADLMRKQLFWCSITRHFAGMKFADDDSVFYRPFHHA